QGRQADAVAHFRKALETDPTDLPTIYALANAVQREGGDASDAEYQRLMEQILNVQPNNVKALVERGKAACRRKDKDAEALRSSRERLGRLAPNWEPKVLKQMDKVLLVAKSGPSEDVVFELNQLANLLKPEPMWRNDSRALEPQQVFVGSAVQRFLRLRNPR